MEMIINFPGGARVDAHFGPFMVPTDQPPQGGGTSSAPTPFATFLASIGTCAGIYVLGFCRQRGISAEGIASFSDLKQTHLLAWWPKSYSISRSQRRFQRNTKTQSSVQLNSAQSRNILSNLPNLKSAQLNSRRPQVEHTLKSAYWSLKSFDHQNQHYLMGGDKKGAYLSFVGRIEYLYYYWRSAPK